MLTVVRPDPSNEASTSAHDPSQRAAVSDADVLVAVSYISPEDMLKKIDILRSMEGDSDSLRSAELRIRAEHRLLR
jgi:hypothetical protein